MARSDLMKSAKLLMDNKFTSSPPQLTENDARRMSYMEELS